MDDCCGTHLRAEIGRKSEKRLELSQKRQMLKWLPNYVKQLEEEVESKDFAKPAYCLGHGKDCPCTKSKSRFTKYESIDEVEKR